MGEGRGRGRGKKVRLDSVGLWRNGRFVRSSVFRCLVYKKLDVFWPWASDVLVLNVQAQRALIFSDKFFSALCYNSGATLEDTIILELV